MLTFEAPFYQIGDVLVFRDHAVKTQFYYLAGLPKLSVDANKKPQFALLKYRNALDAGGAAIKNRDALGGAFLMLGVDCGVDRDSIKGELASQASVDGDITLTPVLYTNGTAQIVVLDYQAPSSTPPAPGTPPPVSHFVKAVIGTTTPSLLDDQRAIFSISLDTDAATLIETAYENDMSPIGVIYHLEFSGLRPAISVQAEVDYKRVYDQLKIDFQFGVHTDSSSSSTSSPASSSGGGTGVPVAGAGTAAVGAGAAVANASASAPPLAQTILIKVQTAGTLPPSGGAQAPTFQYALGPTTGDAAPTITAQSQTVSLTPPGAGQTTFRWTVPGAGNVQIEFQPGNYRLGDQFTIAKNRDVSLVPADPTAKPVSPAPKVVPPASPPVPSPPPAVNPKAGSGPGATGGTQNVSSSNTQVAVDVNIDYLMQKLVESGAVKITIVRQQEGKSIDDMQKEAMDLIRDDILKTFFTPQMTTLPLPGSTPGSGTPPTSGGAPPAGGLSTMQNNANQRSINPGTTTGSGTKVTVGFQLQDVQQEVLRTVTFDYSVQAPVTQIHAPNGFFSALLSKTDRTQLIKEVTLDDVFFKTIDVTASSIADFSTTDLKSVVLDLTYGGTADEPDVVLSPTFTPADNNPKNFQTFIEDGEMAFRHRSSYYFGQNALVGAQTTEYHTDWVTTLSRGLVVNPPIDVPMLHVYVAPGLIDWDLIARIETTLSYDDPDDNFHAERTFLIDSSFQRDDWIVRLTNPLLRAYSARNIWILKDNDRRINGAVQQMSAAQYFVFDPFVDRLPIIVQPEIDPANVSRVTIAFHYQDPANQLDIRKLLELLPPYRTTTVSLPLMNSKKREYSYQATLYKTSGGAENRPEVTTDQMSIFIADGALPFDVTVMLVGDLTQAGLAALQVDLKSEPLDGQTAAVQSHLFQVGGDTKWVQRLMLRTDRPDHTYQVQTTAFYPGKDPLPSDWNDHDTSILVIQPSRLEP
jgi:hypothetical protein